MSPRASLLADLLRICLRPFACLPRPRPSRRAHHPRRKNTSPVGEPTASRVVGEFAHHAGRGGFQSRAEASREDKGGKEAGAERGIRPGRGTWPRSGPGPSSSSRWHPGLELFTKPSRVRGPRQPWGSIGGAMPATAPHSSQTATRPGRRETAGTGADSSVPHRPVSSKGWSRPCLLALRANSPPPKLLVARAFQRCHGYPPYVYASCGRS